MNHGVKGDKQRQFGASHEEWLKRWDAIFGRDLEEDDKKEQEEQKQTEEN